MAFKLVIALTLFLQVQVFSSLGHLIKVKCRFLNNSCRTFNDYANDVDFFFTSDSYFYFVKGTHHLNMTLLISNVVYLSFVGDESNIILADGCSIVWIRCSKIPWSSLNLMFNKANQTMNNSALRFENSQVVIFSNISFSRFCFKFFSRAVLVINSSIQFESCKFEYRNPPDRGSFCIKDSNATLLGHRVFIDNTRDVGGAVFSSDSQIHFNGYGTFVGNGLVGSAIYIQSSTVSFKGNFIFYDNKILLKLYAEYSINVIGTIAALDSFLTMQGVFYFVNISNIIGGAMSLHNTKCSIIGLLKLAGNRALFSGGGMYASDSFLTIQSDESANRLDSFSSECLSKSYQRSITFCNNSAENMGGVIHLEDSNMTLTGSVVFSANKANSGGGISISYSSDPRINNPNFLVFQEPLDIIFDGNVAEKFGGAIYIKDRYLDTRLCEYLFLYGGIKCFFTIILGFKSDINLNFTNNQAIAGAGIYGGAIQYCSVEVKNETQHVYEILQDLIKNSTKIQKLYNNFDALKTHYCVNGTPIDYRYAHIKAQRGIVFNISATVLGEFDSPVSERVAFTKIPYNYGMSFQVFDEHYNYFTGNGCHNLGFRILSEHQTGQLILHPPKCTSSSATLKVYIYLDDCSPGFVFTNNSCKCQETLYKASGHNDLCDYRNGLIKCPQLDWMKPILDDENLTYEGFMWSPNCPAHLCRNDMTTG